MKKYIQPEIKEIQLHLGAALLQASTGTLHPGEEAEPGTPNNPINFSPRHNSILWEDDVEEEEM